MTPAQKAFEAEVKRRLRERATLVLATDQDVIKLLQTAKTQITEQLAAMPSEFAQWRLPPLLAQIEATLDGAMTNAAARVDTGLRNSWQAGEDFVDKPLAAAGYPVEMRLQLLDVTVLGQLRSFTTGRIKDIGAEALRKINSSLGLVTLGSTTPFEAIQAIQTTLGDESTRRATTIVRTEVGRAFSLANQQRMEQAAELLPDLQKQWRRSGKIHSRWNHDVIDGQVVDADKPFILPTNNGTIKIMCPHDPKAPVEEVINCGCLSIPFMKGWQVMTPGAKPFTELELKMNGRKALLDQMAKRLGARKS